MTIFQVLTLAVCMCAHQSAMGRVYSFRETPSSYSEKFSKEYASFVEEIKTKLQEKLQVDFGQPLKLHINPQIALRAIKISGKFVNFEVREVHFDPHAKGFRSDVIIENDQGKKQEVSFSGPVTFMKRVPIFKQTLSPGDAINRDTFSWKFLEDDYRLRHVITDPSLLEGALVKAAIRPGDMPNLKTIKTNRTIEKGTSVEVFFDSPRLSIRATGGRVMAKGRVGDVVEVSCSPSRTQKSQRIVSGVLEPGNRVRVLGAR